MNWRSLFTSKRFWFNVLALIVAIAAAFGFNNFQPDPSIMTLATSLVAIINVVMGFIPPSASSPQLLLTRGELTADEFNYPEY